MKLAVVCTGGGMRCAYSGGALVALAKEFQITAPDIAIGVSGGAGSLTYYLSQQYDEIKQIWTESLTTKMFIDLRLKRPMLDIDYLVDSVLKKEVPFDIQKFESSTTDWHFSVVDTKVQKQSRFFSKKDSLDIFELLRASMAVPFAYGKRVPLGKFSYQDGSLGLGANDFITKAQELGATHIIVIESQPETFLAKLSDAFFKSKFVADSSNQSLPKEDASSRILRIQNNHSPAWFLSRSKAKLLATFNKGYEDILHNPDIHAFLSLFR